MKDNVYLNDNHIKYKGNMHTHTTFSDGENIL